MTSDDRALLEQRALTFSASASLLAPPAHDAIAAIHRFCRTVRDLADAAELDRLAAELRGEAEPSALARAVLDLAPRGVPVEAALQLVEGCRADLGAVRVPDEPALVRHAYLLAGTVGLLVLPLLGVGDRRADGFAVDLGIAMRLSTLARDVGEDAGRDRVYLPGTWLREADLTDGDVIDGGRDEEVAKVVARMVELAEHYYASAEDGLGGLPLRARVAVTLAARSWRRVGRAVRARGAAAVRDRTELAPGARLVTLLSAPLTALLRRRPPAHDEALHAPLLGLLHGTGA